MTYTEVRLNDEYPPGRVDYPDKVNSFIDLNAALAAEVEAARESATSLVSNLSTNYINYILKSNISGSSLYNFINMPWAINISDYVTVEEAFRSLGGKNIDAAAPDGMNGDSAIVPGLIDPDSEVLVLGTDTYGTFDMDPRNFSGSGTSRYPAVRNATYLLDWNIETSANLIELNPEGLIGFTPINGDRLRLIFLNPASTDGITGSTRRFHGGESVITFGLNDSSNPWDFAILELVYYWTTAYQVGWFIKNLILGNN